MKKLYTRLTKQKEEIIYKKSFLGLWISYGKDFIYELLDEIYRLREENWSLKMQAKALIDFQEKQQESDSSYNLNLKYRRRQ